MIIDDVTITVAGGKGGDGVVPPPLEPYKTKDEDETN